MSAFKEVLEKLQLNARTGTDFKMTGKEAQLCLDELVRVRKEALAEAVARIQKNGAAWIGVWRAAAVSCAESVKALDTQDPDSSPWTYRGGP